MVSSSTLWQPIVLRSHVQQGVNRTCSFRVVEAQPAPVAYAVARVVRVGEAGARERLKRQVRGARTGNRLLSAYVHVE